MVVRKEGNKALGLRTGCLMKGLETTIKRAELMLGCHI
jgi:hypothetical protein